MWQILTNKEKELAKKEWADISKGLNKVCEQRGISYIPDSEVDAYHSVMKGIRDKLSVPSALAIPLVTIAGGDSCVNAGSDPSGAGGNTCNQNRVQGLATATVHHENMMPIGYVRDDFSR